MPDTVFRTWMNQLNEAEGNQVAVPESPRLIKLMLAWHFAREQETDRAYLGKKILIPRMEHDWHVANPERRAVYGLYHRCLAQANSVLTIGTEKFLLLSFEVPNQGNERGRRADLLGLNMYGGMVLFEAKVAGNPCGPVASLLEGLDYLSALLSPANFQRIQAEFEMLRETLINVYHVTPPCLAGAQLRREAIHDVIILGPPAYFQQYDVTDRGLGWRELTRASLQPPSIRLRFAQGEIDVEGEFEGAFQSEITFCMREPV